MTANLLRNRTTTYLLYQTTTEEYRIISLDASRVMLEPIIRVPGVRRSHDFSVFATVSRSASFQKQVPKHAPRRWDFELDEEFEQPVDDFVAFDLAGAAKSIRTKQVQRPPDQLKVDADGEDASL